MVKNLPLVQSRTSYTRKLGSGKEKSKAWGIGSFRFAEREGIECSKPVKERRTNGDSRSTRVSNEEIRLKQPQGI